MAVCPALPIVSLQPLENDVVRGAIMETVLVSKSTIRIKTHYLD